jgi:NADH-quinone oxidoreductase subunit N
VLFAIVHAARSTSYRSTISTTASSIFGKLRRRSFSELPWAVIWQRRENPGHCGKTRDIKVLPQQDNIKRLLAYSSVAHAGYMLVALAVAPYLRGNNANAQPDAIEALLFYLVGYGVMTVGAFAVLAYLDSPEKPVETVDDLAGLSRSHPRVALAMTVFLFSLIGIPLTAGFTGKFLVFFGALAVPSPEHVTQARVLAILAAINAAIGGWYYLRIVAVMYLRNPLQPLTGRRTVPGLITVVICLVLTVGLSVPPGAYWLLQATREAAGVRAEAVTR